MPHYEIGLIGAQTGKTISRQFCRFHQMQFLTRTHLCTSWITDDKDFPCLEAVLKGWVETLQTNGQVPLRVSQPMQHLIE